MRNLVLVVHTSLDGFVAGPNGELDSFPTGEENLNFVVELTHQADAALFGRTSFELLESYWPGAKDVPGASKGEVAYSKWYNEAQRIVISRTMAGSSAGKVMVIDRDVINGVRHLKSIPGKDILIFGSPSVAQLLMDADLIDDYWIFVNALTFGKGVPLFKSTDKQLKLKLVETRKFENDEFGLHYTKST